MVTANGPGSSHLVKADVDTGCWSTSSLQAFLQGAVLVKAKGIGKAAPFVFQETSLAHILHMLLQTLPSPKVTVTLSLQSVSHN